MLPPIFAWLSAAAPVTAILGTPPKVSRHGDAPQDEGAPYVTWSVIGDLPENNLSDLPPLDRVTIQADCYHLTDSGIEALAIAVRDALEQHGHMTGMPVNQRETGTRLYRIALQFDFFLAR